MADELEALQQHARAVREAREARQEREDWERLERIELAARMQIIRRVPAIPGSEDEHGN